MHRVFTNSSLRRNGVDTSITLDGAKWNGVGGELSSYVINTYFTSVCLAARSSAQ